MELNEELFGEMYYRMVQSRNFEKKVEWLFAHGLLHGTTHLSKGQEASAIASAMALEKGDYVSQTHRGHAQAIGFGLDVNLMMCDILGKVNGYCKGKGGSMHISDIESGNLGANAIVAGGFPISCGAALTQQYHHTGKVVLCYGGDGSTNNGNFHEALNLASIWKLPVVFFIENNFYGISMPVEMHMNVEHIADRAAAYGIPGITIDGNNAVEVFNMTKKALDYARSGKGPVLIEAETYRYNGHSKSDPQIYRSREEVEEWKAYDPIDNLKKYMIENSILPEKVIEELEQKAVQSIENAYEFAKNSPEPEILSVLDDVYA